MSKTTLKEIVDAVESVANEKGIDKEIIFEALEAALASATRKRLGEEMDVRVSINRKSGDYEVFQRWKVFADDSRELEEPARELRNRARDVLLTQAIATEERQEGVPTEDLLAVDGMTDELAAALAARGVCSREELAEQSTDDLDGVGGLDEAAAGKLIMAARAHWFTEGASA